MQRAVMSPRSFAGTISLLALLAAGCNGGSATAPPFATGTAATPSPSPVPLPASAMATVAVGASAASASLGPVLGGYSASISLPASSAVATIALTLGATQPAGTPAVQNVKRRAQTIGGTGIAPVAFITMSSTVTVSFGATPSFSFTLPPGAPSLGQISYVALYDPTASPQTGWSTFAGPGVVNGNTIAFAAAPANVTFKTGVTYDLVLFGVASALPTPSPAPTSTPTPTPTPVATPTLAASAQHAYVAAADGNQPIIAVYALPLTAGSTPVLKAPMAGIDKDSGLGPDFTVTAKYVAYPDVTHDAYVILKQPLSSSSTLNAIMCISVCYDHLQSGPSIMTLAMSPFGFLVATDNANNPTASQFLYFYNDPFSSQNQTASSSMLTLPNPATGLAFDAAGDLYVGGSLHPGDGDIEEYAGTNLLAHLKTTTYISGIAVNASEFAVAGTLADKVGHELPQVDLYALPITASSKPFATITNGVQGTYVALDAAGNLYVSGSNAPVAVYTAPLSSSSSPITINAITGYSKLVIGP